MTIVIDNKDPAGTLARGLEHPGLRFDRTAEYPLPGEATESDLFLPSSGSKHLYELVDGVLVEKAMGYFESILAGVLIQLLRNYLDKHKLGIVMGADAPLRILPGQVRLPDVSFVSWDHFPGRKLPRSRVLGIAPDLAVEIISEGNSEAEMKRKLQDYFAAGVRLIWYVYPELETVVVYTDPDDSSARSGANILEGGAILPGFRLAVQEWFERAGELGE